MTARVTQPLLILADTDVIVKLHQLGIWSHILKTCQVYTTSSIVKREAKYFKQQGKKIHITLQEDIDNGLLGKLEASIEDLVKLEDIFEEGFLSTIHDGEREALALIAVDKHKGCFFCTSDGPAIKALAMMRKETFGISLENLLEKRGFSSKVKSIPPWSSQETYNQRIRDGFMNVITGEGLVDKSMSDTKAKKNVAPSK